MSNGYYAVFTLYNPDLFFLDKVISEINDQFEGIILVDNSDDLCDLSWVTDKCRVVIQDNGGVSGGINAGLKEVPCYATHVMLFDQDSFIDRESVLKLLEFSRREDVDVCAANAVTDEGFVIHQKFLETYPSEIVGEHEVYVVDRIQLSGMLIKRDVFDVVGILDENFFLNLADTEWCLRLNRKGYVIQVLKNVRMVHEFGEGVLDFRFFKVNYGAPFRGYYNSRDSLRLSFYSTTPYKLKVKLIIRSLIYVGSVGFMNNRLQRYRYWFKGIADYFLGRSGIMR